MSNSKQILCPCGSQELYEQCCGLYISKGHIAPTAEKLMRSRYTAYTLADIDYIQKTMCGAAAQDFDPQSAREWARLAKWKRLKVLESFPHPTDMDCYFVKFSAHYILKGISHKIIEVSEFKRINNMWFYTDNLASE